MKKRLLKFFTHIFIIWTVVFNTTYPSVIFAQEVLPEETETAIIETGDAASLATTETEANISQTEVGEEDIVTTTSSEETSEEKGVVVPEDEESDLVVVTLQDSEVQSDSTSSANTGENIITSPVDETSSVENVIETGDASAVSNTVNIVNVNMVESEAFIYLDTIIGEETRNINLYELYEALGNSSSLPGDTTVITDQKAVIDSDTTSTSNTGENQINSATGKIITGDAIAVANTLNLANLNLVGNSGGYFVINIVGSLLGDIIIPNLTGGYSNFGDLTVLTSQDAVVDSNSQSHSETGENSISSGGTITTGNSTAIANTVSYVNLVKIGSNWVWLIINNYGNWEGSLVNWNTAGESETLPGGTSVLEKNGLGNVSAENGGSLTVITNQNADVSSMTTANSNSGGNSVNGGGEIRTGDAYSLSNDFSLANFVGVGGNFILGFINIVGSWFGNLNVAYPDLSVSITDNKESETPGSSLSYTVFVANIGKAKAEGINTAFTGSSDFIASDPGNNNRFIDKLLPGEEYSYQINGSVSSTSLVNTQLVSSILVSTTADEQSLSNNSATDNTLIVLPQVSEKDERTPDLEINISNNVNNFIYPGDTVLAKVVVANQSPFTAREVKVEGFLSNDHPMPAIPMYWNLGDLKPGEKVQIEFSIGLIPELPEGMYHLSANAKGKGESGNESESGWSSSNFFVKLKYLVETITPEVLAGEDSSTSNSQSNKNLLLDNKKYLPYILATSLILIIFIRKLKKRINKNEN